MYISHCCKTVKVTQQCIPFINANMRKDSIVNVFTLLWLSYNCYSNNISVLIYLWKAGTNLLVGTQREQFLVMSKMEIERKNCRVAGESKSTVGDPYRNCRFISTSRYQLHHSGPNIDIVCICELFRESTKPPSSNPARKMFVSFKDI